VTEKSFVVAVLFGNLLHILAQAANSPGNCPGLRTNNSKWI